ncbi:cytochrome P450 [Streptomyces sp. TRM70308]|uniref:cytochrome P450 n=1 Tax=Streptomyces sp. TRM70308 TaxID=3131932 RepID=UPI003D062173
MPHHLHRKQRRLTQPAFHPARLPGYAQVMAEQIASVTDSWRQDRPIDVLAAMQTVTAHSLVTTVLANTVHDSASLHTMLDDLGTVVRSFSLRTFLPPPLNRLPTAGHRRYRRAQTRLRKAIGSVVADRRAGATDHGDLLSALLAARDPTAHGSTHQSLSPTELTDQCASFFGAGTDTTAAALAWARYLVALHPDIEDRLHAEVDSVAGGRPPTFEDIPRLELTGRVITETLRLYPPIWMLSRVATCDTQLGGHPIPSGATVLYSPYLVHHRPDLYADPERFDPDRWEDGQATLRPSRGRLVPFGAGSRKCIGDTFAMTEATLALATIAARWRLEPVPGLRVRFSPAAILAPQGLSTLPRSRTATP